MNEIYLEANEKLSTEVGTTEILILMTAPIAYFHRSLTSWQNNCESLNNKEPNVRGQGEKFSAW